MKSQVSKEIMRDLKRRYSITEAQAIEIVRSEFDMLSQTMESYSFEDEIFDAVRLPKFGLFFVRPSGKEHFNKDKDEKTN